MDNEVLISQIVKLEPRIGALLEEAQNLRCATWHDYAHYKSRMAKLVGSCAEGILKSSTAYVAAIQQLALALNLITN